jgi:RNA methyltransferase, TrmH family
LKRADAHSGSEPTLPTLLKRDVDRLYDLIRRSSFRKEERAFVVEGPHLLERAFEMVPHDIRLIALTPEAAAQHSALLAHAEKNKVRRFLLTTKIAERISDTRTPQGIFAEIAMPKEAKRNTLGVTLALDRIQDPGNLGTIIRTAAWFDVKHILLSAGSADCYNPKVLRSTQGEIFSVGIREGVDLKAECAEVKNRGGWIVAATSSEHAGSLYDMNLQENITFIFGSEAHGVELSVEQFADERITIPRFGAGESLNVATSVGIILAEYVSRKAKKQVNSYS